MSFKWILFDADGTLFDYDAAEREALNDLWASVRLPPRADLLEAYRRINSALWRRFEAGEVSAHEIKLERFRGLVEELGVEAEPDRLSAGYLDHLGRQTHLLPGAEEVLSVLAGSRSLALITNGLASVQRSRLRLSPIGRHFEVVVISEEVGSAKPDGRIFEAAFEKMGSPGRAEVLMVGDNLLADVEGARRFGLPTCWFNHNGRSSRGAAEPTFEIHALAELPELLDVDDPSPHS